MQHICPRPGCMSTRLHRVTSKKTVTLTLRVVRTSPITPLRNISVANVHTHTHKQSLPLRQQYFTTRTWTCVLERCSRMSAQHATACQTRSWEVDCVLIAHLYRPFIYVSSPRLNTGNASHCLTCVVAILLVKSGENSKAQC
jgi:hypothetical protein